LQHVKLVEHTEEFFLVQMADCFFFFSFSNADIFFFSRFLTELGKGKEFNPSSFLRFRFHIMNPFLYNLTHCGGMQALIFKYC